MSRTCGWCGHRKRAELEKRVLNGEPIRLVAVDAGYSESAGARHMRNHVAPALRAELRSTTTSMHVSDFGARLVELIDESQAVRQQAHSANDARLLLQAITQERDTLGVLMSKLGIDSDEALGLVTEAKVLVLACRDVLIDYPDVCQMIADYVREHDADGLADNFEYLVNKGRQRVAALEQKETVR